MQHWNLPKKHYLDLGFSRVGRATATKSAATTISNGINLVFFSKNKNEFCNKGTSVL